MFALETPDTGRDSNGRGGPGAHSVVRKLQRIKEDPISLSEVTLLSKDKSSVRCLGQEQTASSCHTGGKNACHMPFQILTHGNMHHGMWTFAMHPTDQTTTVTRTLIHLLATWVNGWIPVPSSKEASKWMHPIHLYLSTSATWILSHDGNLGRANMHIAPNCYVCLWHSLIICLMPSKVSMKHHFNDYLVFRSQDWPHFSTQFQRVECWRPIPLARTWHMHNL